MRWFRAARGGVSAASPSTSVPRSGAALAFAVLLGAALRLLGLGWGLPLLFNADEPHFVQVAVSFGSGDLNPHIFKYPTLWMYVLFAAYGLHYLLWSSFGMARTVEEFGALFAWDPSSFYWIGRVLSCGFSCAALAAMAGMERRFFEAEARPARSGPGFPWAVGLLAVSPVLVYSAHEAKPDGLMFLLSTLAWGFAFQVYREGRTRDYILAGLSAGLAFSTQYTALPVLTLLPLAHFLRRSAAHRSSRKPRLASLGTGLAACAGGFLLGCPYALLDYPAFLDGLRDQQALMKLGSPGMRGSSWRVWTYPFRFTGDWSLGGLVLLLGGWRLARADPRRLALLMLPFVPYAWFMSGQTDWGYLRYYASCFPAFALLGALGLRILIQSVRVPYAAAALGLLALGPSVAAALKSDLAMRLPDTRYVATRWLLTTLPQGTAILLDQMHASPHLPMARPQVAELYRATLAGGSRRARYYELMLKFHPGGGYRVYRTQRTARDLWSPAKLVEQSQREGPYVDVRPGLAVLRKLKIRYAVTTTEGATPEKSPELADFFKELFGQAEVVQEFAPEEGRLAGPVIRIYRIP